MSKVAGRKKRIIITTAALVAIGGGAAFAYWSAVGVGTGAATAGQTVAFTVTSSTATGGALTPGGPIQSSTVSVKNENTGVQILSDITAVVANSDGSAWSAGSCTAGDFTVTKPTVPLGQIAAGATVSGTVTIQMKNLPTNQNDCQNVTVPLYITAS